MTIFLKAVAQYTCIVIFKFLTGVSVVMKVNMSPQKSSVLNDALPPSTNCAIPWKVFVNRMKVR